MLRWRFWLCLLLAGCAPDAAIAPASADVTANGADVAGTIADSAAGNAASGDAVAIQPDVVPDAAPDGDSPKDAPVAAKDSAVVDAVTPDVEVDGGNPSPKCPTAKIVIKEGAEVVPQTTLHLKGDGSKGPATIKVFKWTVTQPAGSVETFQPNAKFANPIFVPNVAGEYEFCLDVTDTQGQTACAIVCQKVLVVPTDAVHIELLWDTPADLDQTDHWPAPGADMDLHFAHSLASGPDIDCDGVGDPWFNNPFDCFWFNNSPQWGEASGAIKDDPTLDLDDTDGAGPENLNLEQPDDTTYAIGAHYWNDHGLGPSYATATVFLFGTIVVKLDKILMNPLDFWYIGKLHWPNSLTGDSTPPVEMCYQTAGSKPGDVCAGKAKMWQGKGEWCITPCYANPTFAATTGGAKPKNCP